MKLVLTPSFKPAGKSLEPGEVNLMEVDHSSVVGVAPPAATAIAEKVPDTIAELICSVQPMTKHPLECVKVDFEPDDEVEKKKAEFIEKLEGASSEILANTKPDVVVKCDEENNSPKDVEQGKVNVDVTVPSADHIQLDFVIGPEGADPAETTPQEPGEALEAFKVECEHEGSWSNQVNDNQPVPCSPPRPHKPLAVTKVPATDEHDGKLAAPGPGWWLGDDFCWHPPLTKKQEAYALDLVTALNHPSVVLDSMGVKGAGELVTGRPKDPIFFAPYLPLYTTPPIIPADLQKKMGVSIGGHGTIGPGGEVEDLKFDGAWPIGCNPITKLAPCTPTSIDDAASGFKAGDVWYDSSSGILYNCASCTVGDAVWHVVGEVTPTPDGPKIILSGKPQHIADLEQQEIDDAKAKLLAGPVGVTYTDHSADWLQTHWSPEAEKDLQQAMVEEIKKQIDEDIAKTIVNCPDTVGVSAVIQPVASPGHVNKNGNVYGKSPILGQVAAAKKVILDMEYMHAKLVEATKIPKHLLHGKVHNSR